MNFLEILDKKLELLARENYEKNYTDAKNMFSDYEECVKREKQFLAEKLVKNILKFL